MEDGFVKVYREIREWALYEDSKCVHLLIHLMVSANHKPTKFFFGGELVEVKEGQLITGRKKLSAETGIHESSIERILDKLEKVGEIEQQTNRDNRLITMKKWNKFQAKRTTTEQRPNNDRTTTEQQPNTNKNEKNDKNEYKSRFTPPTIEEVYAYAKEKNKIIDAEKFVNYYASKGWVVGKAPMKDWKAAVSNWTKQQTVNEQPKVENNDSGYYQQRSQPTPQWILDLAKKKGIE